MNFRFWLVPALIVAAGGFVVGQGPPPGEPTTEEVKKSKEGVVAAEPGEQHDGDVERKRRLEAAIERLVKMKNLERKEASEPYVGIHFDTTRAVATLYTAQAQDFPDVFAFFLNDSGKVVLLHSEIVEILVRRWCDFDPKAALAWLRKHALGGGQFSDGWSFASGLGWLECLIAEEAVDDLPEWAFGVFVKSHAEHHVEFRYRWDPFCYLLAKAHPDRSAKLIRELDDRWQEAGFQGWADGMVEGGHDAAVKALIDRYEGKAREWRHESYLCALLEMRPDEMKTRIEDGLEGWDLSMADKLREVEGVEAAVEWYLGRADENETVVQRVGTAAQYLFEGSDSELADWIADLEKRGIDPLFACGELAKRAARRGAIKTAYQWLEKTPPSIKDEAIEAVFAAELVDVMLETSKDGRFQVVLPAPGARKRVEAAGLSKRFERFLRDRNRDRADRLLRWMDESQGELRAVGDWAESWLRPREEEAR